MKDIISHFKEAIRKNRLSHLYLLVGSTGVQKKRLAMDIAYEIFKTAHDSSYLKHQIQNENYPNLVYIAKEGQNIKKQQILALQEEFSKTSLIEGPRVYIIESVESLNAPSANSLLKFLEEPKDDQTVGILLTDQVDQVISTIISRAQVILVEDEDIENFKEALLENAVSEQDANILPYLTLDLEEALAYTSQQAFVDTTEFFNESVEALKNHEVSFILLVAKYAYIFEAKGYFDLWVDLMIQVCLDVIHTHMNQKIRFDYMRDDILTLVRSMPVKKCEAVIEVLENARKKTRVPVNMSLLLQAVGIQLEGVR